MDRVDYAVSNHHKMGKPLLFQGCPRAKTEQHSRHCHNVYLSAGMEPLIPCIQQIPLGLDGLHHWEPVAMVVGTLCDGSALRTFLPSSSAHLGSIGWMPDVSANLLILHTMGILEALIPDARKGIARWAHKWFPKAKKWEPWLSDDEIIKNMIEARYQHWHLDERGKFIIENFLGDCHTIYDMCYLVTDIECCGSLPLLAVLDERIVPIKEANYLVIDDELARLGHVKPPPSGA